MKKSFLLLPTNFLAVTIAIVSMMGQDAARAAILVYSANLNGAIEAPPNASPGTGTVIVTIDDIANTMRVQASFSGLLGNATAAHIHAPTTFPGTGTAGVATPTPSFPGFPSGVTSGTYDNLFDMTLASSYRAAFITDSGGTIDLARTRLFSAIAGGQAYFNLHSTVFPGGEIRGFLTAVPEPSSATGLFALGVLGAGLAFKRAIGR